MICLPGADMWNEIRGLSHSKQPSMGNLFVPMGLRLFLRPETPGQADEGPSRRDTLAAWYMKCLYLIRSGTLSAPVLQTPGQE